MSRSLSLSILALLLCCAAVMMNIVEAQITTVPMVAVYDVNEGGYLVSPSSNSGSTNVIPRPQRLCSTVDAQRFLISNFPAQLYFNLGSGSNFFGARIECLSIAVKQTSDSPSNCLQTATVTNRLQVMNSTFDPSGVNPAMDFALDGLFNVTSFLGTYIGLANSNAITIRILTYINGPVVCPGVDVLYMHDVDLITAQPDNRTATVPTMSNLFPGSGSGAWLGNSSLVTAPTTAPTTTLHLVRTKPSQSNSIFKVVLVPASVDCNSSLVLSSTLLNSSTPYTASYTEPSVLGSYTDIKVSFPRPMVPGLYALCSGVEPSGALTNTTNTTSMTTISTVRVLDIASPAFMTTPDDWLAASTTPPSPPTSSSWTFYFDGLVDHLNVTVDAAAVVIGKESAVNCSNTSSHALRSDNSTTAMPLTDVVPGRVAWVVPASVIAALGNSILQTEITFCYRRNDVVNINNGWRAVPSYHSLSANITGVVLAPYLSAAPLTPSPTTTTTTLPPATTTTTLAPSPTVVGGCPVTTTGALASFGNSQALRFIVNASWSNAMLSNFKSTASTALCVATDDVVGIYQYRQGTNWCVILEIATRLTPVNKSGVIYGPYNGYSRMAAFVYDVYPSNGALYRSNFGILSVQQISETDPDSSGSSDSVAQLVVGVAIAGVISVLICSCGLVYLCCKRLRRRLNHRVRDPNIVAHVDELTVIPRALVIEARARVVIARRVPRNPEDPPGSSSHSDNASDSDASTADGAVLERTSSDAQRAAAARRRMAASNGNEQEMTEIIDSTVYGPADRGENIGYSAPAPPMIQGVPLPRRVRGAPTQPRLSTPPNDPAAVSSSNPLSTPPSSDPDKRRLVVANTPPYELKPSAFSDADAEVDGSILPHLVAVTGGSGSQRSGVRSQSGHITITVGTPPVRRSTELE